MPILCSQVPDIISDVGGSDNDDTYMNCGRQNVRLRETRDSDVEDTLSKDNNPEQNTDEDAYPYTEDSPAPESFRGLATVQELYVTVDTFAKDNGFAIKMRGDLYVPKDKKPAPSPNEDQSSAPQDKGAPQGHNAIQQRKIVCKHAGSYRQKATSVDPTKQRRKATKLSGCKFGVNFIVKNQGGLVPASVKVTQACMVHNHPLSVARSEYLRKGIPPESQAEIQRMAKVNIKPADIQRYLQEGHPDSQHTMTDLKNFLNGLRGNTAHDASKLLESLHKKQAADPEMTLKCKLDDDGCLQVMHV